MHLFFLGKPNILIETPQCILIISDFQLNDRFSFKKKTFKKLQTEYSVTYLTTKIKTNVINLLLKTYFLFQIKYFEPNPKIYNIIYNQIKDHTNIN